jgi:hypothetical protein
MLRGPQLPVQPKGPQNPLRPERRCGRLRAAGFSPRSVLQVVGVRDTRELRRRIIGDPGRRAQDVMASIAYLSGNTANAPLFP